MNTGKKIDKEGKNIVLSGILLQNILFIVWTFLIPADEKNVFFLGYSISRWLLIVAMIVMTIGVFILYSKGKIFTSSKQNGQNAVSKTRFRWGCEALIFALYAAIFLPADRFPEIAGYIVRARPLLLSFVLTALEIFLWLNRNFFRAFTHRILKFVKAKKGLSLSIFLIMVGFVLFYLLLSWASPEIYRVKEFYSIGPGLTSTQVFLTLLVVIVCIEVWLALQPTINLSPRKTAFILFFAVWIGCFILLAAIPVPCQDDRPGPYPPNYACYPQTIDSALSVGSYYIRLGRGVFNQWFTDKPFYMVYLSLGQVIFGENINQYLLFQILTISLVPALLMLIGKYYANLFTGLFLAVIAIIQEVNNIALYAVAGGVNVKLLNTELLTSLLLVILCFFLIKFGNSHGNQKYAVSIWLGIILAAASLTRINPLFLVPIVLLIIFIREKKNWKQKVWVSLVFLGTFSFVFVPAQLSLVDQDGTPHLIQKVKNVLKNRYHFEVSQSSNFNRTMSSTAFASSASLAFPRSNFYAEDVNAQSISETNRGMLAEDEGQSILEMVSNTLLVVIDNVYLSFGKLPVEYTLHEGEYFYNQNSWTSVTGVPIWEFDFDIENFVSLFGTVFIAIIGVAYAVHRKKITGVIPLFIFGGYHIANGMAMTAGGRYLQPVSWVILLYFSIGLFALVKFLFSKDEWIKLSLTGQFGNGEAIKRAGHKNTANRQIITALAGLLIVALIIPVIGLLPDKLETFSREEVIREAEAYISLHDPDAMERLQDFISSEHGVLIEGIAYHPKVYDSPILPSDVFSLEMTVLGDEAVYISNYFAKTDIPHFTDGSRVILIGCTTNEKTYWGMETELVRTYAVIQLSNEQQIFINQNFNFGCE